MIFNYDGSKKLWIDNVPALSQTDIWLEASASNTGAAVCHRRDEIEPLLGGMKAFWIKSPAGIIHLVTDA